MYGNEYRVEYYIPHYLVAVEQGKAVRPTVLFVDGETDVPDYVTRLRGVSWTYSKKYTLRVTVARDNESLLNSGADVQANIIQPGFRTHSIGLTERMIWLVTVQEADGTITVTAPPNGNIAPPGWYMLFVVVGGVPSVAEWVQIGGDPSGFASYPPP
jgi:hypothetical protein